MMSVLVLVSADRTKDDASAPEGEIVRHSRELSLDHSFSRVVRDLVIASDETIREGTIDPLAPDWVSQGTNCSNAMAAR
jgi:hypothetical protein